MSTLRQLYKDMLSVQSFSLDQFQHNLKLDFKGGSRLADKRKGTIVVKKVTKVDPVEDELERLQAELSRRRDSSQTVSVSDVPFIGSTNGSMALSSQQQSMGSFSLQPSVSVVVQSRDDEGLFRQLQERYRRGDCEQVIIEGVFGDPEISVRLVAFWGGGRKLEAFVRFSGFQEQTVDVFKELCHPSYSDALDRVGLSEHQIYFSTYKTVVETARAKIPLERGITIVATLELPPNLRRLAVTNTSGQKLDLYGVIPDDDDDDEDDDDDDRVLEPWSFFRTAPLMTLKLPKFDVEQVYVEVRRALHSFGSSSDGDLVWETSVRLLGSVVIGQRRAKAMAPMPLDHELLQITIDDTLKGVALPDLDSLMSCGDAWRKALPRGFQQEGLKYVFQAYTCNFLLPLGKITSTYCVLDLKDGWVELKQGLKIVFPVLQWSFLAGLPGDASTTNLFIESEGEAHVEIRGKRFDASFDATFSLMPVAAVRAMIENADTNKVIALADALFPDKQPTGDIMALGSPRTCILSCDATDVLLALVDEDDTVLWS